MRSIERLQMKFFLSTGAMWISQYSKQFTVSMFLIVVSVYSVEYFSV